MSTRQQHYSGAKHAKRVRACLEEWSKKNPGKNWQNTKYKKYKTQKTKYKINERTLTIKQGVNKNTIEQQNEKQADIEQMKKAKNTGQQYEKSTNKNRKK